MESNHSYKANPTSIKQTVTDETTGTERHRFVNRSKWQGWAPISIAFTEPVPTVAPANALSEERLANRALLEKLKRVRFFDYLYADC